jgi:MFS family permease
VGWAIVGNTQTAPVMAAKFEWDKEETKLFLSLIGNVSLFGVAIGSIFGGHLIDKGRRKAIFIMNFVVILGAALTLARTVYTIIIGRFICGFAAGILNMCSMKSIVETVPMKYSGAFGAMTNIFLNIGAMLCSVLGMALPADEEDYKEDEMWRLTYGFPIVLAVIQVILMAAIFRWEPIDYSIKNGNDEAALHMLHRLYDPIDDEAVKDEVFKTYVDERRAELKKAESKKKKVGFKEALLGHDYWRATWTCFFIGCCYGFSAIEPVNVYSSTLLIAIRSIATDFPLSVKAGVLIINTANFIGSFLAVFASRYVGRKLILSIGHTSMMVCHLLVGVFMH